MALSKLAIHLLIQGPRTAGELRRALAVSASTLLRLAEDEGPDLIRFGKARATRYGMRRRFGLAQPRGSSRPGLLSALDAKTVRLLDAFGILIGNTDRHFGNLAFVADGLRARPQLTLAPAYDMLPMCAAPVAGLTRPLDWTAVSQASAKARLLDVWSEACALAQRFWSRAAGDDRISRPFRASIRALAG